MKEKTWKFIKDTIQKIPARQLNFAYDIFSKIYKGSEGNIFQYLVPRILPTQGEIQKKAAMKLAHILVLIKFDYLKHRNGKILFLKTAEELTDYRKKIADAVLSMLDTHQLERRGASIFLHEEVMEDLSKLLDLEQDYLHEKCEKLKLLTTVIEDPCNLSYHRNQLIEIEDEQFALEHFRLITKDGSINDLTMLVCEAQAIAEDLRPSIILVPGITCNRNAFHINEKFSFAKILAQRGYWVYIFEPRGMGRNKIDFDVDCSLDTLIDYDLPAVVDFVYKRSKGRPVILLGHSMGGIICEFMLQLWSIKNDYESLSKIKAMITLAAPKKFNKYTHIAYPLLLWLNYALPFLKVDRVPLDDVLLPLTRLPGLKNLFQYLLDIDIANMNIFINPKNFTSMDFLFEFASAASETFPLGIGFQFQKAIYTGKGISRMDNRYSNNGNKYNYTKNIGALYPEIPVFHFLGEEDPLAPPKLNNFIHSYRHTHKQVRHLSPASDVHIEPRKDQLNYYIVPKTKHIDTLYGKTAEEYIYPIIFKAIDSIWSLVSN